MPIARRAGTANEARDGASYLRCPFFQAEQTSCCKVNKIYIYAFIKNKWSIMVPVTGLFLTFWL